MSNFASSFSRKLAGGAVAVLTLAGATALTAAPAAASPQHHGYGHHHRPVYGHWVRPHRCWVAPRRFVDRFGRVHITHVRVCR